MFLDNYPDIFFVFSCEGAEGEILGSWRSAEKIHRKLLCFNRSCQKIRTMASSDGTGNAEWKPPAKIEDLFAATAGNKFASINSPVAGAREERELPVGSAPVQLYSLFTPNGKYLYL